MILRLFTREKLFWLITILVAYINVSYISHDNYLLRLFIRIPQVLLLLYLYRKFINNDLTAMTKTKYRLKGLSHLFVMGLGLIEFITIAIFMPKDKQSPEQTIHNIIDLLVSHFYSILFFLIIVMIGMIPIMYLIIHGSIYLRNLTIWFYLNNRKYFILLLVMEDVILTVFLSFLQ